MMVSTKGRYALIVCLDLAQQDPEAYISLREVAQRQLRRRGFLKYSRFHEK